MKFLCFLLLILLALPVHAGFNLEPYLGYDIGNSEMTQSGTAQENSFKTPLLGARVGYGMMGFSAGLDYSLSLGSFDYKQDAPASTDPSDKYKSTNLGLYVGFTFPVMFRVWGTYFLKNKLELDTPGLPAASGDITEITGSGYALGAGFTGLPFLAINLEYRAITFDEFKQRDGTVIALPNTAFGLTELEAKEIVVSVSVPLDF